MEQPFNKDYSQILVTSTLNIAEKFNNQELRQENEVMLKVYQREMQDSLKLHKFLYQCEPSKPAREGLRIVVRVLLRLSALIHESRVETDEEKFNSMQRFERNYPEVA